MVRRPPAGSNLSILPRHPVSISLLLTVPPACPVHLRSLG
jgi:hypothetical protein